MTWLPGGFIGVDVFFVISGYLISKILFSEIEQHRFSLASFYGRRIRRIFPALAVCLAAVLAYGFVVLMPSELAQLGKQVFFGAGFLSNFALWSESGTFDRAATSKPLLHLWSLGIEEQFYILWPPLLWIAFKLKAAIGLLIVCLLAASFPVNIALHSLTCRAISTCRSRASGTAGRCSTGLAPGYQSQSGPKACNFIGGHGSHLDVREIVCIGDALSRLARFAARGGFGCGHPGRIKCCC
jgi:peptidoglycan/LPS O-acetylase OafA/YrhL